VVRLIPTNALHLLVPWLIKWDECTVSPRGLRNNSSVCTRIQGYMEGGQISWTLRCAVDVGQPERR